MNENVNRKINSLIGKLSETGTSKKDVDDTDKSLKNNKLYQDIKRDNNLKSSQEVFDFLINYYNERNAIKSVKHKSSPGRMTIDQAGKFIYITPYIDDVRQYASTRVKVIIEYVKEFDNTRESIDTVTFYCSSMDGLDYQWNDFAKENNLFEDCICSFDIDLTDEDKNYVHMIDAMVTELIGGIRIDDTLELFKKQEMLTNSRNVILTLICPLMYKYFGPGSFSKFIYPHKCTIKNPNTGDTVNTIKRYFIEADEQYLEE